jgi:hypothetical protein
VHVRRYSLTDDGYLLGLAVVVDATRGTYAFVFSRRPEPAER